MNLDLRVRCQRCRKIPRGKLQNQSYERYRPFCSYQCQELANLENAQKYINEKKRFQPELRVAFEAGYKACERGDNLQMALAKAFQVIK